MLRGMMWRGKTPPGLSRAGWGGAPRQFTTVSPTASAPKSFPVGSARSWLSDLGDAPAERLELSNARRVVVKVGTAVVSNPDGTLALSRLGALVEQIKDLKLGGRQVIAGRPRA
jgi:hypothetical protein